jgi:hypothetical protein
VILPDFQEALEPDLRVLVLWRRGDESAKFEWLPTKWDSGSSNQSRYAQQGTTIILK